MGGGGYSDVQVMGYLYINIDVARSRQHVRNT